ncbi:MAG: leucine-rich repeat domain-containing protein [Prevotellaceae bacterium]|jgi:hypothetical protein|nr:leucine-rich repeat domain-containing protein [Prevotellaceae bacterium]
MKQKIDKTARGITRKIYPATLLSVCLLAMALNGLAQPTIGNTGLYWKLNNNALIITGKGNMPDYKFDSLPPWYSVREKIHAVEIQTSRLTKIGNYVFYKCMNITAVNIPEGVTEIGNWAFTQCRQFKA